VGEGADPRPAEAALSIQDETAAARAAGLRHVTDAEPGHRRVRRGKGFSYVDPDGRVVPAEERARITEMVIPPAWTDVWISPDPRAHLMATGRDARGRKVYLYHPRWRAVRDAAKYEHLAEFGVALPDLRAAVDADLSLRGLPPEKVTALVVRLLDETLVRVGNERYADDNESFGLTTLRTKHVEVDGSTLGLDFVGKSGVAHRIAIDDARLARIAKRCHQLPGKHLFSYLDDDGQVGHVSSAEVNEYLRTHMGDEVSAKDFRTWGGTTVVAGTLAHPCPDDQPCDSLVRRSYEEAASVLGNTPTVCRTSYVHPVVPDSYRDGSLAEVWRATRSSPGRSRSEGTVGRLLEG
jgi:DNA topoisomerase-1